MQTPKSSSLPCALLPLLAAASIGGAAPAFAADYASTVQADGPLAFYRFTDSLIRPTSNLNVGTLGFSGSATNLNMRAYSGALAGSRHRAAFFDGTARAIIPFQAALNPDNTKPFTMEAWFYPASDQINAGQAVINNRYAYSGQQRQGWVIFQRAPNDSYAGKPGYEGVGWNFRMYAGGTGIDVVSSAPYEVGTWIHFVAVYDPAHANGPTTTLYINGEEVASKSGNYTANTDDHGEQALNGPAGMAFGAYNNTAVNGNNETTQSNPFFGAIDEFAFYDKVLTPEKIASHYANGTNSARGTPYSALILGEQPVAYVPFDEPDANLNTAINLGDARVNANAILNEKVEVNAARAIQNDANDKSIATHRRSGAGTRIQIPFRSENNPAESVPLTVELWARASLDRITPGAAVLNNRKASGNRSGWVIFQRAPNDTYSGQGGYEGVGYNFRMYTGTGGSSGASVVTATPYRVGEWQHLVFTWAPDLEGDTGNGNWSGTLTAYVNGEVASTTTGVYHANTDPTDDGSALVDLAVGSYNAASNWGQEFDGDIDEVAIYNNYVLTATQVKEHYDAGTNKLGSATYAGAVLTAAFKGNLEAGQGAEAQRQAPATYLRFNDPASYPAANLGSLGAVADAALQANEVNDGDGPRPPAFSGFAANNSAVDFDGTLGWVGLNNPGGLNFTGNVTLEAWVKPGGVQGEKARIISHGPELLSLYGPDVVADNGSVQTSPELFLQINGTANEYAVGSSDGTDTHTASFAIPAGDLDGNTWVHLAGTYDGTAWKLYRNGALVATTPAPFGAQVITNGDWAIGSTGAGWVNYFGGTIDEPAVYNKALSAAQVLAHYQAGVGATAADVVLSVASQTASTIRLSWTGGSGKFLVQKKTDLSSPTWTNVRSTTDRATDVPKDGQAGFYRIMDNYTGPDIP